MKTEETLRIKGYEYGNVPPSPFNMEDLQRLKETVLFTDEDIRYLKMAGEVLEDQSDEILDLWYDFILSMPHLSRYFSKNGELNKGYMAVVRERFKQWITDTCFRSYDQDWLDYQHEIGLRHHYSKKNKTDEIEAEPIIHFRYLMAFIYPITTTVRPFLGKKGHTDEQVIKMHEAWFKAITLSITLWSYPYVKEDQF